MCASVQDEINGVSLVKYNCIILFVNMDANSEEYMIGYKKSKGSI